MASFVLTGKQERSVRKTASLPFQHTNREFALDLTNSFPNAFLDTPHTREQWNELSEAYQFSVASRITRSAHLEQMKRFALLSFNPIKELHVPGYRFRYGEDMVVNASSNTLFYYPRVAKFERKYDDRAADTNARVFTRTDAAPSPDVEFDRVGVVSYRAMYNLFHFMEGSNVLLHNLFFYHPRIPIQYLYLSHDLEQGSFSGWYRGYLDALLDSLPAGERPLILERRALEKLKGVVVFKRVILYDVETPLHLFWSVEEASWIRRSIYKQLGEPEEKTSPRQITYLSRKDTKRHIDNEEEVMEYLRTIPVVVVSTAFSNATYQDQASLMFKTDLLISMHGNQLSNILFLHKGSAVIEIVNPYFYADFYPELSERCQVQHTVFRSTVISKPIPYSVRRKWWNRYCDYDVFVEMPAFKEAVAHYVSQWHSSL